MSREEIFPLIVHLSAGISQSYQEQVEAEKNIDHRIEERYGGKFYQRKKQK